MTTIYNPNLHAAIALNPGDSPEAAIILNWWPKPGDVFEVIVNNYVRLVLWTGRRFSWN